MGAATKGAQHKKAVVVSRQGVCALSSPALLPVILEIPLVGVPAMRLSDCCDEHMCFAAMDSNQSQTRYVIIFTISTRSIQVAS
jgi:hypothetical protein